MFHALFTSEELRRKSLLYFCVLLVRSGLASGRHGTDIVQRPDDVIGAKCGEELRMTCMAKARGQTKGNPSPPDIEWWYRDLTLTSSATKLGDKKSEGKIEVLVEEFYVVRSTLIIRDAQLGDEGVYQCRASNSPSRHKQNVNVYKHWKIEEAPIADLSCTVAEASTVATIPSSVHVIPASSYNSTKLDDIIRSTVMSYDPHSSKPAPASARPAVPSDKNSLQSGTPIDVGSTCKCASTNLQVNDGSSNCHGTGSSLHRIHDRLYVITIALIMTLALFMES